MSYPNALEICRTDLFTDRGELDARLPGPVVEKIMRVREGYLWAIDNPSRRNSDLVRQIMKRHGVSYPTAFGDARIVRELLPALTSSPRSFHRWRTNEMLIETFNKAKEKEDVATMERAASAYGKLNRADQEDEQQLPYDMIVPQHFTATDDPTVLGIKPIPNLADKISSMIAKYRAETIDIDDVTYEEVDLQEEELFGEPKDSED